MQADDFRVGEQKKIQKMLKLGHPTLKRGKVRITTQFLLNVSIMETPDK